MPLQTRTAGEEAPLEAAADDLRPRLLAAAAAVGTIAFLLLLWLAAALSGAPALRSAAPYSATVGAGTTLTVALALRARRRQAEVWRLQAIENRPAVRTALDEPLARRLRRLSEGTPLEEYAATAGFQGHYGWVATSEAFAKALERLRDREPRVLAELLGPRRLDGDTLRRLERDAVVTDAFLDVLRLQPWLARRLGWPEERVSAAFGPRGAPPALRPARAAEPEGSALLTRFQHSGKLLLGFTAACAVLLAWADRFTSTHPFAIPAFLLAALVTLCVFPALTSPYLPLRRRGAGAALGALALAAAVQLALAVWAVAGSLRLS